uniref:Uncharacterized protein n=1 Tax=Esox lucius TaxID=8010 RepID=A0A3P9AFV1_ESOLU
IHLTISLQKLQQKALQQPKQKKSMSAEFLMGESSAVEGTENPAFDGGYSAELSASQASAGREIQPDRQDSTLAAHQQKMELRAPAKSRGEASFFISLKLVDSGFVPDLTFCVSEGLVCQKEPINKMNGLRPGVGGEQGDKRATTAQAAGPGDHLSPEDMEEYTFSLQGPAGVPGSGSGGGATERARLVLRMLPSELGLSPLRRGWCLHSSSAAAARLGLIMPLLALIWFVRLYLHYCSQWLFLQAIAVPVNKFQFYAHTVELVYQNSLLHTREELAMVVVGPLTLNAATMLLLLIRWACQLAFGSLPSFTSDFIMALGVWTLLDPLAVFAVDAILGRLSYSSEWPVADAAKLYWHFYRTVGSGAAGVVITVFVYSVLFLLSSTILYLYFLRLHNEGRMLDIFQRLSAVEGAFFVPCDLEVSIQEVDYIVQKAEQWRGFNGERRKVAVYDYIWIEGGPLADRVPTVGSGSCTHVSIYTLYLSGQRHRYRHFLRHPDGAILEVGNGSPTVYLAPAQILHQASVRLSLAQHRRWDPETLGGACLLPPPAFSCPRPASLPPPVSQD